MSGWLDKDHTSALVKKATDILFVKNPQGTSMGALFGMLLHGMTKLFDPVLQGQNIVDFSKVSLIFWVLAGIFVFNLRSFFRHPYLDSNIEAALSSIAKAKREGNITAVQAKLMYVALFQKVLGQITLDQPTQEKVREIEKLSAGNETPSA